MLEYPKIWVSGNYVVHSLVIHSCAQHDQNALSVIDQVDSMLLQESL
jgi:hypothetical protein